MYQTVRIDWRSILSWVCASVRPRTFLCTRKTPKNYRGNWVLRKCLLNEPASEPRVGNACHGWSIARDQPERQTMSGDNSGHTGDRLSQTAKSNKSKRRQEFIPSRIEKCGLGIITLPIRLFSVCTNQQWRIFCNAFPFKNSYYFISV